MFSIRGCKRPHYTGSSSNFRAQLRGMKLPKFVAPKIKEILHADAKGLKFVVRTSHARSCFLHFGSEAGIGPALFQSCHRLSWSRLPLFLVSSHKHKASDMMKGFGYLFFFVRCDCQMTFLFKILNNEEHSSHTFLLSKVFMIV